MNDLGAPVGRLQWSKLGVTIYDKDGGFITRIEHKDDCNFLNICIQESLRQISVQMQKRAKFKSSEVANAVSVEETTGVDVRERSAHGAAVGGGHSEGSEVAGTQSPAQKEAGEEQILAAPV